VFFLGMRLLFASVLLVYRPYCCGFVVSFCRGGFLLYLLDMRVVRATCVGVVFACCSERFNDMLLAYRSVLVFRHIV
jgi:hypothetical protein